MDKYNLFKDFLLQKKKKENDKEIMRHTKNRNKTKIVTLDTKWGERVGYSRYEVGHAIGNRIHAHMDYILDIVPEEIVEKANQLFNEKVGVKCNVFVWSNKKPHLLRFAECPDFDTADDPHNGRIWHIDVVTGEVTPGARNHVYHHKWLFVKQDYTGFDVYKSYNWSKKWIDKFEGPAEDDADRWAEQLEAAGLLK